MSKNLQMVIDHPTGLWFRGCLHLQTYLNTKIFQMYTMSKKCSKAEGTSDYILCEWNIIAKFKLSFME